MFSTNFKNVTKRLEAKVNMAIIESIATITSPYNFTWSEVQKTLESILTKFDTPFKIKTEKTRYGSKAGRNWNFGIMLNKDNNMTIGHKRNQQFRAMIHNLLKDYLNGTIWPREDRARLGGLISYL